MKKNMFALPYLIWVLVPIVSFLVGYENPIVSFVIVFTIGIGYILFDFKKPNKMYYLHLVFFLSSWFLLFASTVSNDDVLTDMGIMLFLLATSNIPLTIYIILEIVFFFITMVVLHTLSQQKGAFRKIGILLNVNIFKIIFKTIGILMLLFIDTDKLGSFQYGTIFIITLSLFLLVMLFVCLVQKKEKVLHIYMILYALTASMVAIKFSLTIFT